MRLPRVAITTGAGGTAKDYGHYADRVAEAGGEPILIEPGSPAATLSEIADCLLLSGGVDIAPERYGEEPGPRTQAPDRARDETELGLLRRALEADAPVLAICRGHQLLNVAFGGKLLQHIEGDGHRAFKEPPHESRFHGVTVYAGSRLAAILGAGEQRVNSRHHQAVPPEMVAPSLQVSAVSPAGIVEGLEAPGYRFVVAVQWHPERPELAERSRPLFAALVEAASAVALASR